VNSQVPVLAAVKADKKPKKAKKTLPPAELAKLKASGLCWAHYKYGKEAFSCGGTAIHPCKMSGQSEN
jgi:hypothetical protein